MGLQVKVQMQKMKGRVKSSAGHILFGSFMHRLLLTDSAVVVAFHRVDNTTVGDGLTCTVEMFRTYCRMLSRYFHVVSLSNLVKKLDSGEPVNRDLAITFDDGYRNNLEYAAPVLMAMGLPATFVLSANS